MIDEINVFSVSDEMLCVMGHTGRQQVDCFRVVGPAAVKERSLTVARRDGRTSRGLEVDEHSRPRHLVGRSAGRIAAGPGSTGQNQGCRALFLWNSRLRLLAQTQPTTPTLVHKSLAETSRKVLCI